MPQQDVSATAVPETRSLRTALGGHRNSMGLLRLILASVVILHHSFPLSGRAPNSPFYTWTSHQQDIGSLAVGGFFAISGYLITKSGAAATLTQFIWRRMLRILPAFWLLLVVSAFVITPIFYARQHGGLSDYFSLAPGGPWAYVRDNLFLRVNQYGIADVFVDTPYGQRAGGSVLNGSLWTLIYEWRAYIVVAILVVLGLRRHTRVLATATFALTLLLQVLAVFAPEWLQVFPALFTDPLQIPLMYSFFTGALLAAYADSVPHRWWVGVVAWATVALTLAFGQFALIGVPAYAVGLLWLAAALPAALHWIGAKNDYSYGMYIYGFLVQQSTASLGWYRWGVWWWSAACVAITFVLAAISWHVIESRALGLKDWGPGANRSEDRP